MVTDQRPYWFAVWNHDNQVAREEYERTRELADRPVMCMKGLHELTPDNIRRDSDHTKRRCLACDRQGKTDRDRRKRK